MHYFRESYPEFPKGRLLASESPDFILRVNRKTSVGIELTQLVGSADLISQLETLIQKKETKMPLYWNMQLKQLWLIIYADEALNNISYNLRNKLGNLRFESGFDRLILFDLFSKAWYPISTTGKK